MTKRCVARPEIELRLPRRRALRVRALLANGVTLGAFGVGACSLMTDLDGLSGGGGGAGGAGDTGTDAGTANGTDGGTIADALTSYLPAEGEYTYVQNASAYDGGAFDAGVVDLGVDTLTLQTTLGAALFKRPQAERLPARVTHHPVTSAGACWTLHVDILPPSSSGSHQEDETFCAREGGLFSVGTRSLVQDQIWNMGVFGVQTTQAVTNCEQDTRYLIVGMKPGDVWQHRCVGAARQTTGTYSTAGPFTYLGRELVVSEGVAEDAFHVLRERYVTGTTTGREITELYLSVADALPLRVHRSTRITTTVTVPGVQSVVYEETGSDWLLTSHTPERLQLDASPD